MVHIPFVILDECMQYASLSVSLTLWDSDAWFYRSSWDQSCLVELSLTEHFKIALLSPRLRLVMPPEITSHWTIFNNIPNDSLSVGDSGWIHVFCLAVSLAQLSGIHMMLLLGLRPVMPRGISCHLAFQKTFRMTHIPFVNLGESCALCLACP